VDLQSMAILMLTHARNCDGMKIAAVNPKSWNFTLSLSLHVNNPVSSGRISSRTYCLFICDTRVHIKSLRSSHYRLISPGFASFAKIAVVFFAISLPVLREIFYISDFLFLRNKVDWCARETSWIKTKKCLLQFGSEIWSWITYSQYSFDDTTVNDKLLKEKEKKSNDFWIMCCVSGDLKFS
jgi:hypothetical protein